MKARIGETWETSSEHNSLSSMLRSRSVPRKGVGYVWVCCRNHWRLVGNYMDGILYNGPNGQYVVASVEDLHYLASH